MGETWQLWHLVYRWRSIRPPAGTPMALRLSCFRSSIGPKSSRQNGHLIVFSPWVFWWSAQIFIHLMWMLLPQPNLLKKKQVLSRINKLTLCHYIAFQLSIISNNFIRKINPLSSCKLECNRFWYYEILGDILRENFHFLPSEISEWPCSFL